MKRDKYSKNIRIAIVATVLLIAPASLALGEYLKENLVDADENVKTEFPLSSEEIGHE